MRARGWSLRKKGKIIYSWYSVLGPGRMAQRPHAGTGDSVNRLRRYHCSTVMNYDIYFLVGEQFCFQLLFTTYILGLLPNIKMSDLFLLKAGLFPFSLSEITEILASPSICTKIRTWRFHGTEEVSNNFPVS